jgi:hypothetical protein
MKLPNGEQAEISTQKLIGYCLNPEHPSGKHKARVFASILGITLENADVLRELIQTAAVAGGSIHFWKKYLAIGNRGYTNEVRLRGLSETRAGGFSLYSPRLLV